MPRRVERLAPGPPDQPARQHLDLEPGEDEVLGVQVVQERPQPVEEQVLRVGPGDVDLDRPLRPHGRQVLDGGREQGGGRVGEQRVQVGRPRPQP